MSNTTPHANKVDTSNVYLTLFLMNMFDTMAKLGLCDEWMDIILFMRMIGRYRKLGLVYDQPSKQIAFVE